MKIGFIGCGNMARAMINGMLKKGFPKEEIIASAKSEKTLSYISDEMGITAESENANVAKNADIVILAVKPVYMEEVINEIKGEIGLRKIVVTLAPGKTIEWLEKKFGKRIKLVRIMPNTPAMVSEGMTALCPNDKITDKDLKVVRKIFDSFGKAEVVSENIMDAVVGVSGSSPAFVFMFIEAMADAAVAEGMPRAQAYKFAAQTVMGSAKLMLETGKHPGDLKDMVCSPGGTTIEGVNVLEGCAFRSAVIEAVREAADKSRRM